MSMYNDSDWTRKDNFKICEENSLRVSEHAGRWTHLGPGDEQKWHGTFSYKPNREWNYTAAAMKLKFVDERSS